MTRFAKTDLYQEITDKIIASIEEGTPPWRKPWTGGNQGIGIPLRSTGEAYRGINVLMLWITASENDFNSKHWFTYKQAQMADAQVRKGEKSTQIVYYGTLNREDDQGEDIKIPYYVEPDPARDLGTKPDAELDGFFAQSGADIITSDEPRAYYSPPKDHIHMPPIGTFHDANGYYATLAHEIVHWTGAKSRLDRQHEFKKSEYAFEELVAEIGACMVCAKIGIAPDYPQSAAYIEGWLECLKEDKKAIFKAASLAQKALDYILGEEEASQ